MKKVFIITGEHSGDIHASMVAKRLFELNHDIEIEGIGGENLKAAGVKLFSDHKKMGAVGLSPAILFNHIILGKKVLDYLIGKAVAGNGDRPQCFQELCYFEQSFYLLFYYLQFTSY